jgi:hypothetical protein
MMVRRDGSVVMLMILEELETKLLLPGTVKVPFLLAQNAEHFKNINGGLVISLKVSRVF